MCVIAVIPKGYVLPYSVVLECWAGNSDGAGFMWADGQKVHVHKELKDVDAFYAAYEKAIEQGANKFAVVMHFRIATHGRLDFRNTHPHKVWPHLWVAHNGIFSGLGDAITGKESDTAEFVRVVLRNLPEDFLENEGICMLLAKYCTGSKLAFLDARGRVNIIGKSSGVVDNKYGGTWFSNTSYRGYQTTWGPSFRGEPSYWWENFTLEDGTQYQIRRNGERPGARAQGQATGVATSNLPALNDDVMSMDDDNGDEIDPDTEAFLVRVEAVLGMPTQKIADELFESGYTCLVCGKVQLSETREYEDGMCTDCSIAYDDAMDGYSISTKSRRRLSDMTDAQIAAMFARGEEGRD